MRIVICRSNPIHPDPRVEKEAKSLQSNGHAVVVLGWDRSGQLPQQESIEGLRIYRRSIKASYAHGLSNIFPLLRWQLSLLLWLIRHSSDYDAIHACDFDTVLPALLCERIFRKKVVYDIFDFYADHLRATPEFLKKLIRNIDLWVIGQVDAVILVDSVREAQIKGAHPLYLAIVYNSPEDLISQIQKSKTSTDSTFKITYVGLLQVERGLLDLIEVISGHPQWRLDLAGFGGDEESILKKARLNPNIIWHGRVPYLSALQLEAQADVLIALYDPQIENHRYASPNKVFEAMMLGKPVVVARGTNVDRLVDKFQSGLVIDYGNLPALEQALVRFEQDVNFRAELGKNSRVAYDQEFNWRIMEARLLGLYAQI